MTTVERPQFAPVRYRKRPSRKSSPIARSSVSSPLAQATTAARTVRPARSTPHCGSPNCARHCGEVDSLTGYVTREILVVPIVATGRVLGVLEVMNLPEGRRFSEAQAVRVRDIADALARRLAR